MTVVKHVTEKPTKDGKKAALIQLDDGSKPMWTPDYDVAVALLGKPIPEDWTRKDGAQGPMALPPRKGGGPQAAWRNSESGAKWEERQRRDRMEMERVSRERWQQEEEDRKDRRTALMTAVELLRPAQDKNESGEVSAELCVAVADWMYEWLRSSPAAGPADAAGVATTAQQNEVADTAGGTTSGEGVPRARRLDPGTPQGHGGSPDTSPEGDAKTRALPSPSDTDRGEDHPSANSPRSTTFPVDPSKCDHKMSNGHWVRWALQPGPFDGGHREVCPKCGTPKLIAMESTTADLGPAQ